MNRIVAVLAFLLIGYSIVLFFQPRSLKVDRPVLTLELSSTGAELKTLLDTDDARQVLTTNTHLDNFYIPTYTAFFIAFIWMAGSNLAKPARALVWGAIIATLIGAASDYDENYHIFAALGSHDITDATALAIRHPSLVKWALLNVASLAAAVLLFLRGRQPFGVVLTRILGTFAAISAVVGFCGLYNNPLLPLGALLSFPLPLASLSLFWRRGTRN